MSLLAILLGVQVTTFVVLGVAFLTRGEWRYGVAQLLAATGQVVLYSGGIKW